MMLVAMSLTPLGDTAGKLMTDQSALSPFFAAWNRFAVGALILAFFVRRAAYKLLFDWRIIARASILVCGITSILTALSTVPIATMYEVFFIGAWISYILAVLFLKEPIGPLHLALVAGAFTGVLIVLQPQGQFDPNLAFAVLVGLCYDFFCVVARAVQNCATGGDCGHSIGLWGICSFAFCSLELAGQNPCAGFWEGGIRDCLNGWHVAFTKRLCFGAFRFIARSLSLRSAAQWFLRIGRICSAGPAFWLFYSAAASPPAG